MRTASSSSYFPVGAKLVCQHEAIVPDNTHGKDSLDIILSSSTNWLPSMEKVLPLCQLSTKWPMSYSYLGPESVCRLLWMTLTIIIYHCRSQQLLRLRWSITTAVRKPFSLHKSIIYWPTNPWILKCIVSTPCEITIKQASFSIFSDLHSSPRWRSGTQKVANFFIVNFNHAELNLPTATKISL